MIKISLILLKFVEIVNGSVFDLILNIEMVAELFDLSFLARIYAQIFKN